MFYFMDIFYAMGMNLTKKTCVKFGQTDDVVKKFPRKTAPSFWKLWLIPRMKMVSSPTLLSWTNCAASKSTMPHPTTICYQNQKTNNSKLTKTTKIQTAQNMCKQHPHYG